MAIESQKTVEVNKPELIAQLDSARWQLSRDCRELGDDFSGKLSVKGQLQRSIQNRPSVWGLGVLGFGIVVVRLIFRKKSRAKDEKAFYEKPRSSLFKSITGPILKTVFLAFEPLIASVLKERISSSEKPTQPHV